MSYYGSENYSECHCYLAKPISWCVDAILIPQIGSGTYIAEILDHLDIKYRTVLVDKKIVISDLPDGIFSPYAGSYQLKVYLDGVGEPFRFVFDAETYECITLRFQDSFPIIEQGIIE